MSSCSRCARLDRPDSVAGLLFGFASYRCLGVVGVEQSSGRFDEHPVSVSVDVGGHPELAGEHDRLPAPIDRQDRCTVTAVVRLALLVVPCAGRENRGECSHHHPSEEPFDGQAEGAVERQPISQDQDQAFSSPRVSLTDVKNASVSPWFALQPVRLALGRGGDRACRC